MQIKLDANGKIIPESDQETTPARIIEITDAVHEEVVARSIQAAELTAVRQRIDQTAEPLTREGVISDVAAVLVVGLAQTVRAIATGKDLAEIKAAVASLQPFADAVLSQLVTAADMRDPVSAMQAGKVLMPYMVKGDAAKVVKDMGQLANGVSAALLAARRAG